MAGEGAEGQPPLVAGGVVSERRDLSLLRALLTRVRRCALARPLLFCTDGLCSSVRAIRETFREPLPTGKPGRPRRQVEAMRRRSQGAGVINTAYSERLNATFRERWAPLVRRGRALARCTLTLEQGMDLIGTVYNFCTPHAHVRRAAPRGEAAQTARTPAMAAGITEHRWTMSELLSFHVPPPRWTPPKRRGRRSRTLQLTIERWCYDHG